MDLFVDVLVDGVRDTAQLVPFLFITYLAMEAIEHSTEGRVRSLMERVGALGPIVGSLVGALPQCGFSAMAATLFSGGVVTAGTLVAVILSTSDEMVPVFLAHQEPVGRLAAVIAIKVVVGVVVGLAVDLVLRLLGRREQSLRISELCERADCHCDDDLDDEHDDHDDHDAHDDDHAGEGHHHGHGHHHGRFAIVRSAAIHTVQVTAFIFVVSIVFGLLIEVVGQDSLALLLGRHPVRATVLAGLVGLIPNCGASVVICELYLSGSLGTGPMLAGLLVSGGVGLLVLFRTNTDLRQNLLVTAFVYTVGVLVGLAVGTAGIIV